jgi:hypothetical protein
MSSRPGSTVSVASHSSVHDILPFFARSWNSEKKTDKQKEMFYITRRNPFLSPPQTPWLASTATGGPRAKEQLILMVLRQGLMTSLWH